MKFIATLSSGATADVDEIFAVARSIREAVQPKPTNETEPKPTDKDEPNEIGTTLSHGALSQSTMAQAKIDD